MEKELISYIYIFYRLYYKNRDRNSPPTPLVIDKIARYVLTHFRTVTSPDFFKAAFFTFGYFKEENKVVFFSGKLVGVHKRNGEK